MTLAHVIQIALFGVTLTALLVYIWIEVDLWISEKQQEEEI